MKKIIALLFVAMLLSGCGGASQRLSEDEFWLYEDGDVVMESADYTGGEFIVSSGNLFETKRGVKIGTSEKEFLSAYHDVLFDVYYEDGEDRVTSEIFASELAKDEKLYKDNLVAVSYTCYEIEGEWMDRDLIKAYMKEKGLTALSNELITARRHLGFTFYQGKVTNIRFEIQE